MTGLDAAVLAERAAAVSASVSLGLGAPATAADAFRLLAAGGVIDHELADRLDLRAFLAALRAVQRVGG